MPGKRPRQIRRTTSMSQLGGCGGAGAFTPVRTAATAPESFEAADCTPSPVAKNAVNPPGLRPPCGPQDPPLHEDMEVCSPGASFSTSVETATAAVQNGGNPQSMAIDVGVEESLDASHADKTSSLQAYKLAYQPPHLGYSPQSLCNRSMVGTQSSFYRGGSVGSVQQAYFLDVCYHCMKRLGHGRDIFIYRGDRAFCSVECRHHQIAADERREKWGLAAVKKGVGATTPAGSTGQQMGTAAAA